MTEQDLSNQPTDLGQPQAATVGLGEQLGLPDGQFVIERNVYDDPNPDNPDRKVIGQEMQYGGWAIEDLSVAETKEGQKYQVVRLIEPATGSTKKVPLELLRSWQPQPEEDPDRTLTRAEINALRAPRIGGVAAVNERPLPIERAEAQQVTEREAILFAPAEVESHREDAKDINFDLLLNPDSDLSNLSVEDAAIRNKVTRGETNDELREAARFQLELAAQRDPEIRRILNEFTGPNIDLTAVDGVRTNKELRMRMAQHLSAKLESLVASEAAMRPEDRVLDVQQIRNTYKKPAHGGYDFPFPITSREYVTLLALAKIDGTFDNLGSSDTVMAENGTFKNGSHRFAASLLL